ncbi:MAG: HAD-IC family P-type ATPase, partial [Oscillospiraceae bacterium]|nr:HAD-IC family P-type ATPase [Oscillospiraceae bacterium]
ITAKGGKFLEAMAVADTIVFDKTGTLTKATPTVHKIIPFCGSSEEELLRIAACLEEHFPHSMANAVVKAASDRSIQHSEMHSKVDYIVAHGIASYVEDKRVVIGSHHFVFEDEGCTIQAQYHDRFESLPLQYSHLYMAIDGVLAAVICIEDPIRPEAPDVIRALRAAGFRKIVMMTGDSERTAAAIAAKIGVDEYHAEVLPEDKASFVRREQARGGVVVMVGDGINDSPARSSANVEIAIRGGAQIAREIAAIMIAADDLRELVNLRALSRAMMQRIDRNYRLILGINGALIALGVAGVIQPTTSALLHNTSTLLITLQSMSNLIERGAPTADTPCNA